MSDAERKRAAQVEREKVHQPIRDAARRAHGGDKTGMSEDEVKRLIHEDTKAEPDPQPAPFIVPLRAEPKII